MTSHDSIMHGASLLLTRLSPGRVMQQNQYSFPGASVGAKYYRTPLLWWPFVSPCQHRSLNRCQRL